MAHYNKLVPTIENTTQQDLPDGETIEKDESRFFDILFGGDQLTVARMRGVQNIRDTQARLSDQFKGILPVIEDWHSRMISMKVN